jgi:N-acyl homoserine lactone hydrolase
VAHAVRVRRVDFGYFVRPADETAGGRERVEPVLGYLVDHPQGRLLFDTGMGAHPDVDAHYRPRRADPEQALRAAGARLNDVDVVVNCHLHFDHCGNNPAFRGRPIFVQDVELTSAHAPDYTLPELIDADGLVYEQVSGDAEIWAGISVVPTPGHTAGHQSLIVHRTDGDVVVLCGQGHDTASGFSAAVLAVRAADDGHLPSGLAPEWVRRLTELDPSRVYFAHDHSVWIP